MSEETKPSGSSQGGREGGREGGDRPRGGGPGGGPRRDRGRGRFRRGRGRRRVCKFCADKSLTLDYKWSHVLEGFVSERGRIVPSRTTGTCSKHQRALTIAVKRARNVGLLPFKAS